MPRLDMDRSRRWVRVLLGVAIVAAGGCTSVVHYNRPGAVPSKDKEAQPDPEAFAGPAGLYTLVPLPADVDPLLGLRMEHVEHAGCTVDVCVGEAIAWAFQADPDARVRIRFGESRFEKELHFGGVLDGNSDMTYLLYVTVSIDGGPPQSVVASGRSADMAPADAVTRAVAVCVRDLRAKVNNLLRAEAQAAVPSSPKPTAAATDPKPPE